MKEIITECKESKKKSYYLIPITSILLLMLILSNLMIPFVTRLIMNKDILVTSSDDGYRTYEMDTFIHQNEYSLSSTNFMYIKFDVSSIDFEADYEDTNLLLYINIKSYELETQDVFGGFSIDFSSSHSSSQILSNLYSFFALNVKTSYITISLSNLQMYKNLNDEVYIILYTVYNLDLIISSYNSNSKYNNIPSSILFNTAISEEYNTFENINMVTSFYYIINVVLLGFMSLLTYYAIKTYLVFNCKKLSNIKESEYINLFY